MSVLIAAGALSADTLVLRDGTRIDGTMLGANQRTVNFVDADGRRRDYSITNIQEVRFSDTEYTSSRSRTEIPGMAPESSVDLIQRLTDDIAQVVDRASLSTRQRQMLQDATNVISRAGHDMRENLSLNNRREVQMALDNVRYVMNSTAIRTADRKQILGDIAVLRDKHPEFASSRTDTGSRNR